jgi:hypothetical protein
MISEARKSEVASQVEYAVQRYIDKQGLVEEAIWGLDLTEEELEYIRTCWSHFTVEVV